MQNIKEKVVVITSASSGLGEPTAPSRYRRGKRCAGCATGGEYLAGRSSAVCGEFDHFRAKSR